jgi:CSLREA domain-containing protein
MPFGRRPILLAVALAFGVGLAQPASSSALPFLVNSTADGGDAAPGNMVCETATGNATCTLRAAIGETNALAGLDSISFSSTVFNGTAATSTINLTTGLPTITSPVNIDGGSCLTGTGEPKPCTAINADDGSPPTGFTGLVLVGSAPDNSSIKRVAVFNAANAIVATNAPPDTGADNVSIEGNWLGMDLNQSPGSNADANNVGVALLGDNWDIGGTTAQERNVFRANSTGIFLRGGDNNTIAGNYFGTRADGSLDTATNSTSIWIDSNATTEPGVASGNVIGGPDVSTPSACDGPCNLLAAPAIGTAHIHLEPTAGFPAGATSIQGNFIGLGLNGAAVPVNFGTGVNVGNADNATIGGATATARNYIGGGVTGISAAAGAADLTLQNNYIGVQPDRSGEVAPSEVGAAIGFAGASADRPQILGNRFAGNSTADQDGLRLTGTFGLVQGNELGRDAAPAAQPFGGDAIEVTGAEYEIFTNQVHNGRTSGVNLTGTGANNNVLNANTIQTNGAAAAGPGVRIQGGAADNTLGADPFTTPANINRFVGNAGDAIEVLNDGSDDNLLYGNLTTTNNAGGAGQFIDLNGDGPGNPTNGPNAGVSGPTITFAGLDDAAGTAEPNALIVLYTAQGTHPDAVLATGTASGSGNWAINYTAVPEGTKIFANQTRQSTANTSELTGPVAADETPPDAPTLTDTDPDSPANENSPFVKGTAEAGSTVRLYADSNCTGTVLGMGNAAAFSSPGLAPSPPLGENSTTTFRATATDAAGNTSACSAPLTYVEDSIDPALTIDPPPVPAFTSDNTPTFSFHATDANPGVTYQCTLPPVDPGSSCNEPSRTYSTPISDGSYTFTVTATDAAGNDSVQSVNFTVDTLAPVTVIDTAPSDTTGDNTPTLTFHTDDANAADTTFSCKVDSGLFASCSSPATFGPLVDGSHTISIVATDPAGNEGAPEAVTFTVDALVVSPPLQTTPIPPTAPPAKKKCKKGSKLKKVKGKKKCVKKKKRK